MPLWKRKNAPSGEPEAVRFPGDKAILPIEQTWRPHEDSDRVAAYFRESGSSPLQLSLMSNPEATGDPAEALRHLGRQGLPIHTTSTGYPYQEFATDDGVQCWVVAAQCKSEMRIAVTTYVHADEDGEAIRSENLALISDAIDRIIFPD